MVDFVIIISLGIMAYILRSGQLEIYRRLLDLEYTIRKKKINDEKPND